MALTALALQLGMTEPLIPAFVGRAVPLVEMLSLGVLAIFIFLEVRAGRHRESLPLGLTLMLAAWWGEDTCIRWYGFYQYSPDWHFIIDKMPPMVALIWPFVILSDLRVVTAVAQQRGQDGSPYLPLWLGIWVTLDATLMEAVSVQAGLWSWNEPGLFDVPLIGVLGWGYFAGLALFFWRTLPGRWRFATVLLAPLGTHALLLLTWWGALKWMLRGPFEDAVVVGSLWLASVGLSLVLWRQGAERMRVDLSVMGIRILAASVFFALLVLFAWGEWWLWLLVGAFVPPYILATDLKGLLVLGNRARKPSSAEK